MRTQDIYWAAGLYEGEGYAQYNGGMARVSIGSNDQWTAEKLKALFGGNVYSYEDKRDGRHHNHYTWRITGPRARGFLMTIFLLLSPRRKAQIRSVLVDNKTLPKALADELY